MPRRCRVVQVQWIDSSIDTAQISIDHARKAKPQVIYSYGMVVKQTKKRITLALDYHPIWNDVRLCITIPMCAVLRIDELRKRK